MSGLAGGRGAGPPRKGPGRVVFRRVRAPPVRLPSRPTLASAPNRQGHGGRQRLHARGRGGRLAGGAARAAAARGHALQVGGHRGAAGAQLPAALEQGAQPEEEVRGGVQGGAAAARGLPCRRPRLARRRVSGPSGGPPPQAPSPPAPSPPGPQPPRPPARDLHGAKIVQEPARVELATCRSAVDRSTAELQLRQLRDGVARVAIVYGGRARGSGCGGRPRAAPAGRYARPPRADAARQGLLAPWGAGGGARGRLGVGARGARRATRGGSAAGGAVAAAAATAPRSRRAFVGGPRARSGP
jgi:hypothetical protein